MSTERLFKLAERFARKISLAQSAQAGDIERNLKDAGLWGTPESILFPILDELDINPNVEVTTSIKVDSNFNVTFPSVVKGLPPAKSLAVAAKLKEKYGQSFSDALKNGKIYDTYGKVIGPFKVGGTASCGWHVQTPPKK